MQRRVVICRGREIAPVGAEVSDRQPIRRGVYSVRRDCHWSGKIGLLPARSGFARKRYGSEGCAIGAPQTAHVSSCIGRAFVKANAGDGTADIRLERNAQLQRATGSIIARRGNGRARPDRLLR